MPGLILREEDTFVEFPEFITFLSNPISLMKVSKRATSATATLAARGASHQSPTNLWPHLVPADRTKAECPETLITRRRKRCPGNRIIESSSHQTKTYSGGKLRSYLR